MFGGLLRSWNAPHTGGPTGTSSFLPTASEEVMPPLPVCDKVSSGACSCEALKQYWPVAVLYPGSSIEGSAIVWPPARRAAGTACVTSKHELVSGCLVKACFCLRSIFCAIQSSWMSAIAGVSTMAAGR